MIKDRIIPRIRVMAFQTIGREPCACVLLVIIRLVAGQAILLVGRIEKRCEVGQWRMAGGAFEGIMRTNQVEPVRHCAVVEGHPCPGINSVALLAVRREAGACVLLIILGLVARNAVVLARGVEQRIEVRRRRVASRTGQRDVRPDQRKAIGYRGMIERRILPGFAVVTFQAVGRKAATGVLLIIIGLMTGQAILIVGGLEARDEIRRRTVTR